MFLSVNFFSKIVPFVR